MHVLLKVCDVKLVECSATSDQGVVMSWQKQSRAEAGRTDQTQQATVACEQCKHGLRLCRAVLTHVPELAIAQLLLKMCQCHTDIIRLLEINKQYRKEGAPAQVSRELGASGEADANNRIAERLGQLLNFQQGLLQQLRKTIRVLDDRNLIYPLSACVASLQILHDQLSSLHRQT